VRTRTSTGPGEGPLPLEIDAPDREQAEDSPHQADVADAAGPVPEDPSPSAVCRVLVVEDNQDVAESLEILLSGEGYEVRLAHDGPSSIEIARAFRPHVVLLDIELPGMDGYDVAHHLRGQAETQAAALIALTGYGQAKDRQRSQAAGFDHHLLKPIQYDKLEPVIRSLLQARTSSF
jgi:two-component system CheB/CheR fusion protein